MSEKISYAKTVYGQEEIDAVVKCLNETTQMGTYSRQFESEIAKLFDKKECLYVNSGSSALHIGVEAFDFTFGETNRKTPEPKGDAQELLANILKQIDNDQQLGIN